MNQYEQSESIKAIAPALSIAQQAVQGAVKNSSNPHFGSNFADLGAVRDAALPALKQAKLSLTQWPVGDGQTIGMVTQLTHDESGEWMRSTIFIAPDKRGPQPAGSVLTYLRRYCTAAVLGIPQVDDDGNAGQMSDEERRDIRSHETKTALLQDFGRVENMDGLVSWWKSVNAAKRDLIPADFNQLEAMKDDQKATYEKEQA